MSNEGFGFGKKSLSDAILLLTESILNRIYIKKTLRVALLDES